MQHQQKPRTERILSYWLSDRLNPELTLELVSLQDIFNHIDVSELADALMFQTIDDVYFSELCNRCIKAGHLDVIQEYLFPISTSVRPEILRYYQILIFYIKGEFNKVIAFYEEQSIEASVEESVLYFRVLYNEGRLDEACSKISNLLIQSNITNVELIGLYALMLLDRGQVDEALRYCESALDADRNQIDALLCYSSICLLKNQFHEAVASAGHLIQLNNGIGRAWSVLAQGQFVLQLLPEAKSSFEEALRLMPQHIGTWHAYAWLCICTGDVDISYTAFQASLQLEPGFAETHGGLATIAALKGHKSEAVNLIKKAYRLDSQCQSARFADALIKLNDGDEQQYKEAVDGILSQNNGYSRISNLEIVSNLIGQPEK